ncbi:MAG TPA: ankyrin repeat domain-containing protein [Sedimentisphaerales bacterium]|nr:ankyrin repeat domain-containing protein [Sedimentisphaerales bacterium]
MRVRFVYQIAFSIVLLCQLSTCLAAETPDPADPNRYLDAVRTFADNVLKYGRDTYGPKHTPLFVDGLNTETLAPVVWRNKGEEWILSDFANHQGLLRLLDGLTALTGEGRYRQAALDASAYALANLRTPNGLLYWGGHMAWDLQREKGVSEGSFEAHELREQSPYYELLWEANPSETKRLMETIWGAHVWDWTKLDFNRHSNSTMAPRPPQWTHEFDENLVCPFPSVTHNLSFSNFAGSLLHTGALLAKLGNHREALLWTRRFAQRWHSACHPVTGLCGGLLSHPRNLRARRALAHNHPNINEAAMVAGYMMHDRYNCFPLFQMQVGEELGDDGLDLIRWASDDLKAFARYAYDEKSLSFRPLLTDGTELNWREFNPGYFSPASLAPQKASGWTLWVYATAYRLTRDPAHWKLLRSVWRGFDLGDLGTEAGDGRHLNYELKATSNPFLYACLDLHTATKDKAFLMLARQVADNILTARTQDRCLPKDCFYVRTGDEAMLAVLHLAAALQGKSHKIPQPKVDRQYFHCAFSDAVGSGRTETDARVWDEPLFYGKRKEYSILPADSNGPPISIGEAISMGNMGITKTLFARETDIENRNRLLFPAVQSGNEDIVEFFLLNGADVNVRNGWQEETPLHLAAALKDASKMIELLIDKGADPNAKNWKGDTPLQYAAHYDHKKIVELLLQKGGDITNLHIATYMGDLSRAEAFIKEGVDINARDGHGCAPLHYAVRERQKQVMELLVARGADLDVKNWEGKTPFTVAVERGHKDVAELLANKGANVSSADNEGSTPLHRAVQDDQRDMVTFLIDKGTDVNAKDGEGQSVLDIALNQNRKETVELLLAEDALPSSIHVAAKMGDIALVKSFLGKGANINEKGKNGLSPLHTAVWGKNKVVVEFFLAEGADVNAKDQWGYTPLYYAIWNEDANIVELIVDKGADVNILPNGDGTPLEYAVWNEDVKTARLFVAHGAKFDVKDNDGWTAFRYAVSGGNWELVAFFVSQGADVSSLHGAACMGDLARVKSYVEQGADVDTQDEMGWTPLYWAASLGQTEVAMFLIQKGADVKKQMEDGSTALHQAAQAGDNNLVQLLVSKGADVNAKTKRGQTPLHSAASAGQREVAALLIAKGAEVNATTTANRTPLHNAALGNHKTVVELLLDAGADASVKDRQSRTPLAWAQQQKYTEIAEILRKHGAKE